MSLITDFTNGLSTGLSQGSWVGPLIQAGLATGIGLTQPSAESTMAYGNTKEGFEAQMAFEREKLAQQLALSGGGGGSGDAMAAARLSARVNLAGLKEKQMADALAARLRQQEGSMTSNQNASSEVVRAAQTLGQTGQQGYGNIAQILSRYAR